MIKKIANWILDYFYFFKGCSLALYKPPKHYLGYILEDKPPIVLIPGLYLKWHFLKAIADPISLRGYPVHVVERLGYNTKAVGHSAKLLRDLIDKNNLYDAIIIAIAKGV